MHLDVRSVERAMAAVKFFEKRIPHAVMKLSHICILNRLFSHPEEFPENFDLFFDTEEVRNFDLAEAPETMTEDTPKGTKYQIQEVECFSVIYFKDGIGLPLIDLKLSARRAVAFKHFMGDTDYSSEDYVRDLIRTHAK